MLLSDLFRDLNTTSPASVASRWILNNSRPSSCAIIQDDNQVVAPCMASLVWSAGLHGHLTPIGGRRWSGMMSEQVEQHEETMRVKTTFLMLSTVLSMRLCPPATSISMCCASRPPQLLKLIHVQVLY